MEARPLVARPVEGLLQARRPRRHHPRRRLVLGLRVAAAAVPVFRRPPTTPAVPALSGVAPVCPAVAAAEVEGHQAPAAGVAGLDHVALVTRGVHHAEGGETAAAPAGSVTVGRGGAEVAAAATGVDGAADQLGLDPTPTAPT